MRFVCPKGAKKMLLQRARTVYWKPWTAKHEIEELKEGAWLEPALTLLRKKTRETGLKSIEPWPENWFRKEVGRRRNSSIVVGRMKVSVKHVTKRTARKSTGLVIAQSGKGSEGRSQRLSESGSNKRRLQRKNGGGKEVLSRILSVKATGTDGFSV